MGAGNGPTCRYAELAAQDWNTRPLLEGRRITTYEVKFDSYNNQDQYQSWLSPSATYQNQL